MANKTLKVKKIYGTKDGTILLLFGGADVTLKKDMVFEYDGEKYIGLDGFDYIEYKSWLEQTKDFLHSVNEILGIDTIISILK